MIYNTFNIVVVPFPFTDQLNTKNRPALILSNHNEFSKQSGHSVFAMITSARNTTWPLDVAITDLSKAGLSKDSVVRMKFFTLDNRLIRSCIGTLSPKDKEQVMHAVMSIFKDLFVTN
jgi:mRNA interferase MazF